MVRHVDAVFTQGAFRPVEPLSLPEGTRVRLSVEHEAGATPIRGVAKIVTPTLADPLDAKDFVMEVRQTGNADV